MSLPRDLSSLGIEVPVGSIEQELKRLWEADSARTNASLINFAIYSEDGSALEKNSELAAKITREHACRALLIGIDKECEETSLRAWVTAHCHLAGGRKSICSEQLAFHLTGRAIGRFRNTVFAHLNSDLPLDFWWQGDLSDRFNERLYSLLDRLVVDSADWGDAEEQFGMVGRAMEESNLVVQDLSWTRIYHYRLALAGLFDEQLAQEALEAIRTVRIVVHPDYRMSGLQLAAWIAEQAGWKLGRDLVAGDTADAYRFEKRDGDLVDVSVSCDESSAPVGSLTMRAPELEIEISREAGGGLLHQVMRSRGHVVVDRHAPADCDGVGELVVEQLSRGGKNSLFRKVLPMFLSLLRS